jgi:hypothetical protein
MKKTLKYLPFLSGFAILLGVLKLSIYYQHFNIEIISYLSLSDILISFLNDINSIAMIFLIGAFHYSLSNHTIRSIGEITMDRVLIHYRKFYVIFFAFSLSIMLAILSFEVVKLAIWNVYLTVFFCSNLILFIFIRQKKGLPENEFKTEIMAENVVKLLQVIVLASTIVFVAYIEIRASEESTSSVKLTMKDGTIIDNKTKCYLGKVGAYHFFSNQISSLIIKDSDVSKIEMRN